ncbi:uncharacterized protein LOC128721654 [Anopheles nili]|uniref:uncharacterized protein LOC128721654 n=1 Tax=Anopheles nili TaxID=185578 RepID=UPI00237A4749|nr:uncharacterized protein LOC128721654 [Anopheles nili]
MGLAVAPFVPVKTTSDAVKEMAPALTEPLSQSKLSSSAASGASPRTSSSTTATATVTDTLGGTTIIPSPENVHSESHDQSSLLAELVTGQEHDLQVASEQEIHAISECDATVTVATTTSEHHGSGDISMSSETGIVSTTVDDIQNNNNGVQGLKLEVDPSRDLIELALEQLHHDASMGGGGESCEVPAMPATNVANMDVSSSSPMPGNMLHLQEQSQGDLMSLAIPPAQGTLPQGSLFQDSHQQQLHPQYQQQMPLTPGGMMAVPLAQDSSQSSSSLGGAGVSGSSELGMQLKESSDMDQMIRELSTSDIDIMQVLRSFDNNSLLLFSDADVANLCDVPVGDGSQPQTSPNKDRERLEQHAEIVKLQALMQRKQDFLARRLSKIKARYMGQHVSEEIAGLYEYTLRYWKKCEKENAKQMHNNNSRAGGNIHYGTSTLAGDSGCWPDIIPFQAPPPDQTPEKLKPISANALKTFSKRLESISNTICSVQSHRVMNNRYFHGVSNAPAAGTSRSVSSMTSGTSGWTGSEKSKEFANISNTIPMFEQPATQELEQTAGMLYAELRQVQETIDSDATLSSSGGESADESMPYVNALQEPLAITERAAWKWANNRAAVASRWTWVVARIADLEYRIRQHNEVLNKIRINKGPITLEGLSEIPEVNGYRGPLPGSSKAPISEATDAETGDDDANVVSGCCRTRPYCREKFRKRRLLQTHNLHTVSKKAAKSSNIKCGCQWPLLPCALCTGRPDPTAPRDPADTMTFSERVALLDASYHPVLSFPEDISHSIHLEAIMRTPEWQSKMIRSNATTASTDSATGAVSRGHHHHSAAFFSSGDETAPSSHGKRYASSDGKRKYGAMTSNKYKSIDRSMGGDSSNKYKRAKSRRDVILPNNRRSGPGYPIDGSRSGPNGHNKNHRTLSKSRKSSHSYDYYDGHEGGVSRSKNSSPTPNTRNERRHRNNSYDIGSIVIPQSMAASTRVSLPQYKDITIPKWRIVDEKDDAVDEMEHTSEMSGAGLSLIEAKENPMGKPSSKTDPFHPPNGTKTTTSIAIPSTSGYTENSQQQQQLIVIPAQDEEDISEEAIMLKHERALQEERKKFRSYLKFPWSRPRAKRRTESRAGSSGGNTPDPTSPAPPTPMIEHDSSPACPSTPITSQDGQELSEANVMNALNKSLYKKERRRTVSSKREDQQAQGAGTITPDTREIVSPYETLEFPLANDIFEGMLRAMPSDHIALANDCLSKLTGRNGLPYRRKPARNNNIMLRVKSTINLAPASLGIGTQNPLSSNASTATTVSATETDLEDFDDEDLMLAKRTENQLIMERLLNSRSESQQYEIVPPSAKPMLDDDEDVIDDEETDTGESLFVEEDDPNDPEWNDRSAGRSTGGAASGFGSGRG